MSQRRTTFVVMVALGAAAQGCTSGADAKGTTAVPAEVVMQAGWGSGNGSLGRFVPDEGSPEGPMSFDVDADGRLYVLDQVNARVAIVEPSGVTSTWPLPADTFHDIAVGADGTIAALDRLAAQSVAFFDAKGTPTGTVSLAAPGIDEPGDVTALVRTASDTYVEVEHDTLVRIADASGGAAAPVTLPGRPTRDGKWLLSAELAGLDTVRVTRRRAAEPNGAPAADSVLSFAMPVSTIDALASDGQGRAFVGVTLLAEDPSSEDAIAAQQSLVVVLDTKGDETMRFEVPTQTTADEHLCNLRVGADGEVYQLDATEAGATIRRYEP